MTGRRCVSTGLARSLTADAGGPAPAATMHTTSLTQASESSAAPTSAARPSIQNETEPYALPGQSERPGQRQRSHKSTGQQGRLLEIPRSGIVRTRPTTTERRPVLSGALGRLDGPGWPLPVGIQSVLDPVAKSRRERIEVRRPCQDQPLLSPSRQGPSPSWASSRRTLHQVQCAGKPAHSSRNSVVTRVADTLPFRSRAT